MVPPVLTIDGPSGAGKGTVSRLIASKLGWNYLDSGAIYRSLAIALKNHHVDISAIPAIIQTARLMNLKFSANNDMAVHLDGVDITRELGTEATGNLASQVAAIPEVRQALLEKQQNFRQLPGLVADGRDMGTVVFPDAEVKIYLTASIEERADRRYKQLKKKGIDVTIERITSEIEERDRRDMNRVTAPLVQASDAYLIDSSVMTIEQVISEVLRLVTQRLNLGNLT